MGSRFTSQLVADAPERPEGYGPRGGAGAAAYQAMSEATGYYHSITAMARSD
jgi:hypothetical protein